MTRLTNGAIREAHQRRDLQRGGRVLPAQSGYGRRLATAQVAVRYGTRGRYRRWIITLGLDSVRHCRPGESRSQPLYRAMLDAHTSALPPLIAGSRDARVTLETPV